MDLHQKVASYIKKYYPDVMINASLSENQDTSEKRITSYKAGYVMGVGLAVVAGGRHVGS